MKRIIFLLVLGVIVSFYFVTNNNEIANDYYESINKKFLEKDYLEDDEYVYNTFSVAQEESDKVLDNVVKDIVSNKYNINNVSDKIKVLYNNALNYEKRNSTSITPLKGYIDKVNSSGNINELINNIIYIENELGIDIFTKIDIDKDFKNNKDNIVYLFPVTFAFGSSVDYFVDENYMVYKAYIKKSIINLLEKYGMSKSEARLASNEIISFYTNISKDSKLASSYEEVTGYYNVVDKAYLKNVYSHFDMVSYLKQRGIDEAKYSLVDEGQYKSIDKYLIDEYLMVWKKVILVKILSSYAEYLDIDYRNIVADLDSSLTGSKDKKNYEEEAINLVSNVFGSEIDLIYEGLVITNEDKVYLGNLFNDIKKYFKKVLESNTWLSKDTKEYALYKLDSMKVCIGICDNYEGMGKDLVVSGNNLVENVISINKSSYKLSLDKLNDNDEVSVSLGESIVNAYYNPMENTVYIPSAIMFLLDDKDSYYELLGTIGMIIAHEITHGFDYNGSMFDSEGNLKNWWSDTDRDNFTSLKNEVSKYYSNFEVIDGKYIDGDKTVNENIADMGALKVISGVAKDRGATMKEFKEMYTSFAKFWRSQETKEYAKLLLLNDSHAPNKYRVNAVLSVIKEFYDVYDIYPWNDMYISKNNRISVW